MRKRRPQRPFVIVGNPQNRRVAFFQRALCDAGQRSAAVVSYIDLLEGRTTLGAHLKSDTLVRIESPERDFAVERALLRHGLTDAETEGAPVLGCRQIADAPFDPGLILHPRQNYLGFRRLLRTLGGDIASANGVGVLNPPADIEIMFDKRLCHERASAAGLPVPAGLGPVGGYEELLIRMGTDVHPRVFLKLANGSAASGVVALQQQESRRIAVTTAELVRTPGCVRLYNSRLIRCYTEESDIATIVNIICREGAHAEQWLPKASLDKHGNFDLRFVVIAGRAEHVVMRHSKSPITNLHLLNLRGDVNSLRERMDPRHWRTLQATCARAMSIFPESLYAGIDLLLMPGLRQHAILEMNAFGDLLPEMLHDGLDTYAAELAAASLDERPAIVLS